MNYKQMLDKLYDLERRILYLEQQQRVTNWPNTIPQWPRGCSVCGLGSDGRSYGYVCNRTDCPTAITCNLQDVFK